MGGSQGKLALQGWSLTNRIVYRRSAANDLDEAVSWYEAQRPGLGAEFLSAIEAAIGQLHETPEKFPVVHGDVRRVRARRFPYSIYFRVRTAQVVVVAVFHARRDPSVWKRRV